MRTQKDIIENIRKCGIGEELRAKEYIKKETVLISKIADVEEAFLKTLDKSQVEIYKSLESLIWEYADIIQRDSFFHGYSLAKELLKNAK